MPLFFPCLVTRDDFQSAVTQRSAPFASGRHASPLQSASVQHESVHVGADSAVLQLFETQSLFVVQAAPMGLPPLPTLPVQLKNVSVDPPSPFSMHATGVPSTLPHAPFCDVQHGWMHVPPQTSQSARQRLLLQRELLLQSELPA